MTQPSVSNALRRLRGILGDDLVRRSGYGVQPTPRALALWPVIHETLQQLQSALSPSVFEPATASATFVLAMADATAAELMPGLIDILGREAPGVSVRFVPLTTRDPRALLEDESVDLAIGYFPAVIADLTARTQSALPMSFEHRRLYDGEYVCVMRQSHPLARGPLTLARYCAARHMIVSFSGRPFDFVDQALAAIGRQRRIVLTVNQFFTAGRAVANSDLLTVLPRHFVRVTGIEDALVLRELPFEVPVVHIDALWHRRMRNRSDHAWLRQAIARAAQQAFASEVPAG